MSSSETDDSPVHNHFKSKSTTNTASKTGLSYNFAYTNQQVQPPPSSSSSSTHQYTLPYKSIVQQQHQVSSTLNLGNSSIASIGLNQSLSPSSENASDATLTDTDSTALARKTTSLINNGKRLSLYNFFSKSLIDVLLHVTHIEYWTINQSNSFRIRI